MRVKDLYEILGRNFVYENVSLDTVRGYFVAPTIVVLETKTRIFDC